MSEKEESPLIPDPKAFAFGALMGTVVDASLCLCVLGGCVGKTSLVCRFLEGLYDEEDKTSTVETNYRRVYEPGDAELPLSLFSRDSLAPLRPFSELAGSKLRVNLELLDTSGDMDMYEGLRPSWYERADGVMFVFSVCSKLSFDELEIFHAEWLATTKKKAPVSPPAVLVGTMSDSKNRKVTGEQARAKAEKWGMACVETSAKTGDDVDAAFHHIISRTLCSLPTLRDLIKKDASKRVATQQRERKLTKSAQQRVRKNTSRAELVQRKESKKALKSASKEEKLRRKAEKSARRRQATARKRALKSEPTKVFGQPLASVVSRVRNMHPFMPDCIADAIAHVLDVGLEEEGIFRLSGSLKSIHELASLADRAAKIDWSTVNEHDTAGFIKLYVRELPEPLFPEARYDSFIQMWEKEVDEDDETAHLGALRELLQELPEVNVRFLRAVVAMLSEVAQHSEKNKMQPHNCTIVFAPNIMYVTGEGAQMRNVIDMPAVNGIIMSCLRFQNELLSWIDDLPMPGTTHASFEQLPTDQSQGSTLPRESLVGPEKHSDESDSDEEIVSSRVPLSTVRQSPADLFRSSVYGLKAIPLENVTGTISSSDEEEVEEEDDDGWSDSDEEESGEDRIGASDSESDFNEALERSISRRELAIVGKEELLAKLAAEARAEKNLENTDQQLCERCDVELAVLRCRNCSKPFFCEACHEEHHTGRWASHEAVVIGSAEDTDEVGSSAWTVPVQSLSEKRKKRSSFLGGSRLAEESLSPRSLLSSARGDELEELEQELEGREQAIAERMAALVARKKARRAVERQQRSAKDESGSAVKSVSSAAAAVLGNCVSCSQPVPKGGGMGMGANKVWHRACFVCCECGLAFNDDRKFAMKKSLVFHVDCRRGEKVRPSENTGDSSQLRKSPPARPVRPAVEADARPSTGAVRGPPKSAVPAPKATGAGQPRPGVKPGAKFPMRPKAGGKVAATRPTGAPAVKPFSPPKVPARALAEKPEAAKKSGKARFTYQSRGNTMSNGLEELSLTKGEVVDIVGPSPESKLWLEVVLVESGKRGLVPANYIVEV